MKFTSSATIVGLFLILAGALGSLYFGLVNIPTSNEFTYLNRIQLELFKFCMTSMFAVGLALLFSIYQNYLQEKREKFQVKQELIYHNRQKIENFLINLIDTYNHIKSIRRRCERAILKKNEQRLIDLNEYNKLMDELTIQQLELEKLKRFCKSKPDFLKNFSRVTSTEFEAAEKFLRKVTKENERKKLPKFQTTDFLKVEKETEIYNFAKGGWEINEETNEERHELLGKISDMFDEINLTLQTREKEFEENLYGTEK